MHLLYKICRADNPEALHADFQASPIMESRPYDEVQEDALTKAKATLEALENEDNINHDNGVDSTSASISGSTSTSICASNLLWKAAEQGHHRVVLELMQHAFVDPNKARNEDNTTPLYISAYHGHEDVVTALLGHPCIDVNKGKSTTGASPLLIAAQEGREGVVKALLEHPSIDVRRADGQGTTPLLTSCAYRHEPVVELLIQHASISETEMREAYVVAKKEGEDRIAALLSAKCGSLLTDFSDAPTVARREAECVRPVEL